MLRAAVLPAAVQRRIVRGCRRGLSLRQIADVLNRDGVPPAHGGREWYASTVRGVLRRQAASAGAVRERLADLHRIEAGGV